MHGDGAERLRLRLPEEDGGGDPHILCDGLAGPVQQLLGVEGGGGGLEHLVDEGAPPGDRLRLGEEPRVLDGHARLGRQGLEEQHVGLPVGVQPVALHIQHADDAALDLDGDAQLGADRLQFGDRVVAGIAQHVVDQDGLGGAGRLGRQARLVQAEGDRAWLQAKPGVADGASILQDQPIPLHQQQAHEVVAEPLLRRIHDLADQRVQVQHRSDGPAQLVDYL